MLVFLVFQKEDGKEMPALRGGRVTSGGTSGRKRPSPELTLNLTGFASLACPSRPSESLRTQK